MNQKMSSRYCQWKIANWENRENCQRQATETVLLLLRLAICALSPTRWARVLLSLAFGKYPSVKLQLQCPWEKALESMKSCNPIKFHQIILMLIFKINNHLILTINICWCASILALFRVYWQWCFSTCIFFCNYLSGKMCTRSSTCFLGKMKFLLGLFQKHLQDCKIFWNSVGKGLREQTLS